MEDRVFTVAELTLDIKALLGQAFPRVWVEGEVSRLTPARSGHFYFTLRDTEASLSAALFRGNAAAHGGRLREGARVQCRGRLDVYPPRGGYQLVVDAVREAGAGALMLELEQRKQRLAAEGLFDTARKKPLPYLPRTVGVVTSPTGAALRDILHVLRRRFPVRVLVAPAVVQGAASPAALIAGLRRLDARPDVDVILLSRGGGAMEDLWGFNDEGLVRAVAAARKPVVSAVGHEIDSVLTDLAADRRAPTPSAAAELVVPERRALLDAVPARRERLVLALRRRLEDRSQRLDEQLRRAQLALQGRVAARRRAVAALRERLRRQHPGVRLTNDRSRLSALRDRLRTAGERLVSGRRARVVGLTATLRALGPEAQLARGYAIVRVPPALELLRDSEAVREGQALDILLHRGALTARVETRTIQHDSSPE